MTETTLPAKVHGGPAQEPLDVQARWDPSACVWWAESDDLPGLVTEASSFSELVARVRSLAPRIIEENLGQGPGGISIRVSGDGSQETFTT